MSLVLLFAYFFRESGRETEASRILFKFKEKRKVNTRRIQLLSIKWSEQSGSNDNVVLYLLLLLVRNMNANISNRSHKKEHKTMFSIILHSNSTLTETLFGMELLVVICWLCFSWHWFALRPSFLAAFLHTIRSFVTLIYIVFVLIMYCHCLSHLLVLFVQEFQT